MSRSDHTFVLVVCGGREHIDTLHLSLAALRRYSACHITVVTDTRRNDIPVLHDDIVDIATPAAYDHHQASIYLKTSLHRILPAGRRYCYLDTDVVALDQEVDSIFHHYVAPITFCTDHCTLDEFSPSAVHCGCIDAFRRDSPLPYHYFDDFQQNILPGLLYIDACIAEIEQGVAASKKSSWAYAWHRLRYLLPGRYYHLNEKYKMDKLAGIWYDAVGRQLAYPNHAKDDIRYVSEKTGFCYDPESREWSRPDGSSLTRLSCTHLHDHIRDRFGVTVHPATWQHWNGGVFLFDDRSFDFLDYWHQATISIFSDTAWRTRDQGTLAASVWHFGLQQHPMLPVSYNLIADYHNKGIAYRGGLTWQIGTSGALVHPHFIHIYHHWGDEDWLVWRDVKQHITSS
ncbi:MAG: hypothetical protein JST76_09630 [Bacteroidetes bacterium]|nr:hypothetical protein [Bacteroidota bacterium]